MIRSSLILATTLIATTLLYSQYAHAWVIIRILPKGHVPKHRFTEPLVNVMSEVPPVYGDVIDGFSHYTCRLYYRGTQDDVQNMLDRLGKIDDITLVVNIDRTGQVGIIPAGKQTALQRPLPYLYQVSLYQNDKLDQQPAWNFDDNGKLLPASKPTTVTLTVHSAGGLKPNRLQIPKPEPGVNQTEASLPERESKHLNAGIIQIEDQVLNKDWLVIGQRQLPIKPLPQPPPDDSGANH